MATVAGGGEIQRDVARIVGALEIFQMAGHASRAVQAVVIVDMAIGASARRVRMHAGQRETGGGVIEMAVSPLHGVVALLASRREPRMRDRSCRVVVIGLVTANTRRAGQVVIVVDVAISALARRHGVATGEKEPGRRVVELGIQPVVGAVAGVALSRELRRHVVRIDGGSKVRLMAGEALRRHRLELAVGATLVTGVAVDRRVRSGEREAIVVLLNILVGDLPSAHRVALLAIRAQLATVNVGVAILALVTDVSEHHLYVTLRASDGGVHAAKRVLGLIVIEFGNGADRFPRAGRVTILARDCKTPVRTVRTSGSLPSRTLRESEERENKNEHEFRFYPSAHDVPLRSLPTVRKHTAEKEVKSRLCNYQSN